MSRRLIGHLPVYSTSYEDVFYPEILVDLGDLKGPDGNAFFILAKVCKALEEHGIDPSEYHDSATLGDYEHLLSVTRATVEVLEIGSKED